MEIALVDDKQEFRNELKKFIKRFCSEKEITLGITEFSSGNELLNVYAEQFDIIILDIDMPGINGMQTARKIRETDSQVILFFITNIAQYAIDGYDVDAVGYMLKPLKYYDFSMKFIKALRRVEKRENKTLIIETTEGKRRIEISELIYIEIFSHYLIFHGKEEEWRVRGKMSEQEKALAPCGFCRIHKSYIINLSYVKSVRYNKVELNNQWIPIGRSYHERFMQEYMRFMRE